MPNAPRSPLSPALVAAAWTVGVAAVLWLPAGTGPPRWGWLALVAAFAEAGGDKLVHAGLFAGEAWLLCRCRPPGSRWRLLCFALAAAYGAVTELGQLWIPGRDAGPADALANVAGAALGAALDRRPPAGSRPPNR